MEYSKEDLMEAKKQIWGVGENEYYRAWEHPFSRLRACCFSPNFSYLGAPYKHNI